MVALDSALRAPSHIRFNLSVILIVGGLLGGLCAAGVPLALFGSTYQGWTLAARTTDEFAGLLFLIAFLAGPLARLFPNSFTNELQLDRRRLALGFASAYCVYLFVAIFAASAEGQKLGAPQASAIASQFILLAAMAATSDIRSAGVMGLSVWRRFHTAALWLFWLVYTFAYIGHFVGPHVPDASYGMGLGLMIAALLIRHAAALKSVWIRPVPEAVAEKVG